MKHSAIILLFLISVPGILLAQNPLFLDFGQSKNEVWHVLNDLTYLVDLSEDLEQHTITAKMDDRQIEYIFKGNELYAIRATHFYDQTKAARQAIKGSLDYFQLLQGTLIHPENRFLDGYYVSLSESRLLELSVKEHEGVIEVSLHAISRHFGPRSSTEDYVFTLMAGRN